MTERPRVVIGAPTFKYLSAEAHGSHMGAAIENASQGILAGMVQTYDALIEEARNEIVDEALKHADVTHIWFLDDDVIPPSETLARLLKWDVPVVSGLYFKRDGTPVVYNLDPWEFVSKDHLAALSRTDSSRSIARVQGVGMGCCLIQLDVLARVKQRFTHCFDTRRDKDNTKIGEDVVFCEHLHELEIPVWLDYDLCCAHAKTVLIGRE